MSEVRKTKWGTIHPSEYAKWPWQQCHARKEPRGKGSYFGRCELRKGHPGDHALERGMDEPRWSTEWTA